MADKKLPSPNGSPKPAAGKVFHTPKTQCGLTNAKSHKSNAKIPPAGKGGGKA